MTVVVRQSRTLISRQSAIQGTTKPGMRCQKRLTLMYVRESQAMQALVASGVKWWDVAVTATPRMTAPTEKVVRAVARSNAEMTALACQRIQAFVGAPARFAACRTPLDLMTEQIRFWQTATDQYNAATQALVTAWTPVMPLLANVPTVSVSGPAAERPLPEALQRILAPSEPMRPVRDLLTLEQPVMERQREAA